MRLTLDASYNRMFLAIMTLTKVGFVKRKPFHSKTPHAG